jgi:hypothetical protein
METIAVNEAQVWAEFFAVHPELKGDTREMLEVFLAAWELEVTAENLEVALLGAK